MGKAFLKNTADLLQKKHKRKQWQKIMISLSLVVALLTSCLLIHPAITMSRQATCGQEEHTHTEKCYEKKLICNKEEQSISESSETEGEESVEAHTHSDACYENVLICGKQEHTHSEACYPKEEEKKEEVAANTEEEKSEDKDVKSEDQEDKAEEKTEDTEKAEARTLEVDQADYTVEVDCPAEANIPKDAKLKVREIKKDSDEYQDYYEKAMKAVASGDETDISFARFFDISFEVDGKEIEPEAKVEVKITYDDKVEVPEKGKVKSVHFGNKTEVLDVKTNEKNGKMDEVKFDADSFSVYAIVGTSVISTQCITANGESYEITVTYGSDANIPANAKLFAAEVKEGTPEYTAALEAASALIQTRKNETPEEGENQDASVTPVGNSVIRLARFFDIKILNGEEEVQPQAPVSVNIVLKERVQESREYDFYIAHLGHDESQLISTAKLTNEPKAEQLAAEFETSSFSVFGTIITVDPDGGLETGTYALYCFSAPFNYALKTDLTGKVAEIGTTADNPPKPKLTVEDNNVEWAVTALDTSPRTYTISCQQGNTVYYLSCSSSGELEKSTSACSWTLSSNNLLSCEYNGSKKYLSFADGAYCLADTAAEAKAVGFARVGVLTTVETVDSVSLGVKMRLKKWKGRVSNTGSGNPNPNMGVVKKILGEDGYPVRSRDNVSLNYLFDENKYSEASKGATISVEDNLNHLFRSDIYNETGYLEYDCFQNAAYLDELSHAQSASEDEKVHNFTLYDQIATVRKNSNENWCTRGHFTPYAKLEDGNLAVQRNITGRFRFGNNTLLPQTDPRYNEKLFFAVNNQQDNWSNPLYDNGLYLEAPFVQAEGGKVNGEDMVYEFIGDDDLWIYFDNVLILDLGGSHWSEACGVNLATGDLYQTNNLGIVISRSNIKQRFKDAGIFPDGTEWKDADVDKYFTENTLKDFSRHTMKMFYMENGYSAASLYMRFNLPIVQKEHFQVTKELSGSNQQRYANTKFAFQAFRRDGTTDIPLTTADGVGTVDWASGPVTFGTNTYTNVFFLKPGETANFNVPEGEEYKVVEIGVDPALFDKIQTDDTHVVVPTPGTDYMSLDSGYSTTTARPIVAFKNHCSEGNKRNLYIRNEVVEIQDLIEPNRLNETKFSYKIYLEGTTGGTLTPYANADYYLVNENGEFMKRSGNTYVVDETGEGEVIGQTDSSGIVTDVPYQYSVVLKNLLSTTDFYVESVDGTGCSFKSKAVTNNDHFQSDPAGITGSDGAIKLGKDSEVVLTYVPHTLTVSKSWLQEAGVIHDAVTVALYRGTTKVDNVEKELKSDNNWTASFKVIDDTYAVREMDGSQPLAEGDSIVRIESGNGGSYRNTYLVSYEDNGISAGNRSVTVKNSKAPKIRILKTDGTGNSYLSESKFKLTVTKGSTDVMVADNIAPAGTAEGAVVSALANGDYKLTEIKAPAGYIIVNSPVGLKVENGLISLTNDAGGSASLSLQTVDVTVDESIKETEYQVKVKNTAGTALPNTGGKGTGIYTFGGMMLFMMSALMYSFRMRRRERRSN